MKIGDNSIVEIKKNLKFYKGMIYDPKNSREMEREISEGTLLDKNRPIWLGFKRKDIEGYAKSRNGFILWMNIPTLEDIENVKNKSYRNVAWNGLCDGNNPQRPTSKCKNKTPLFYEPEIGSGMILQIKFKRNLNLLNLTSSQLIDQIEQLQNDDIEYKSLLDILCQTIRNCEYRRTGLPKNNKFIVDKTKSGINRRSNFFDDNQMAQQLKIVFPDVDGYIYSDPENKSFHDEVCIFNPSIIESNTKIIQNEDLNEYPVPQWIIDSDIPLYEEFIDGESFSRSKEHKLYTDEEIETIISSKQFFGYTFFYMS